MEASACARKPRLRLRRFGQFRKFGKIRVGEPSSPATPRKQFLNWVQVLVRGYLRVRFDFPSSINFRDIIKFFFKLGIHNPY